MEEDDWLVDDDDDFAEVKEYVVNGKKYKSQKRWNSKIGSQRSPVTGRSIGSLKSGGSLRIAENQLDGRNRRNTLGKNSNGNPYHASYYTKEVNSFDGGGKHMTRSSMENRYQLLSEEIELDEKWLPLLDYLSTFGFSESHFIQMYERHMPSLQINVCSAQERLEYLLSVGVKQRDVRRILLRQPQILEYTVENNLKSHVNFLMNLGIPSTRI